MAAQQQSYFYGPLNQISEVREVLKAKAAKVLADGIDVCRRATSVQAFEKPVLMNVSRAVCRRRHGSKI